VKELITVWLLKVKNETPFLKWIPRHEGAWRRGGIVP
jgi:hypothetical protein